MPATDSVTHRWMRPATIALAYGACAAAWILFSGLALDAIVGRDGNLRSELEQIKGFGFVAVTAFVLFLALRRYVGSIEGASRQVERLAQFPKLSPHPVVEVAGDGSIVSVNAAAAAAAAACAGSIAGILPSGLPGTVRACIASGVARTEPWMAADGRVWEWTVFPLFEPPGASAYGIERTEQDRLQAQIQQAARMESVGRMAAGVAHDLNNILTAIGGYASLIEMQKAPDVPTPEEVSGIKAEVQRATILVKKLLSISRMREPGSLVRTVELNGQVAGLQPTLRQVVPSRVRLTVAVGEEAAWVQLDADELEQSLLNLVTNAVDAIDGDGEIRVTSALLPGRKAALVSVKDDGQGISSEVLPRIFDPFFTTKAEGRGTGLGLASVHAFVRRSAGQMDVESNVGGGTSMNLTFPIAPHPGPGIDA